MPIAAPAIDAVSIAPMTNRAREEAISALLALGYKPPQAEKMIKSVFDDALNSEELIREALKSVA